MSHLPLSLMNRLSQTECCFQTLATVFPNDLFFRLFRTAVVWKRVALNPGLGGVRDGASSIISFSDYLGIQRF